MAGRVGRTKAAVSYLTKCAHAVVMGLFLVVVCIYAITRKLPERSTMIRLATGAAIGGAFSPQASWLLRGRPAAYRPWGRRPAK